MWKKKSDNDMSFRHLFLVVTRRFSRVSPTSPAVIRVSNNIASLGPLKGGKLPRQLLFLPPFPSHPLPAKNNNNEMGSGRGGRHVTAISWVKYYFNEIHDNVIQSHFNKGLVQIVCPNSDDVFEEKEGQMRPMRKIKPNEVMEVGARVCIPVSVAETRISKRFDTIPSGTLYPNADEIDYLQRLVRYKDPAILVLNKPPRLPVKGNLPVHNSMDALAAAALSYDYEEGPKLVHRLDRESSGLLIMGRTKESSSLLHWAFSDLKGAKSSFKALNDACEAMYQRYWALVIGSPKEREGLVSAPLSKVLLDDGKTERVVLAQSSDLEASQEAITEYRVLGPTINGCSWIELRPLTSRKHQDSRTERTIGTVREDGNLYLFDDGSLLKRHCQMISLNSIADSVFTALKVLVLQLSVTISMVGLCTGGGSSCLELILSRQRENPTNYVGQKALIYRREVCYPRCPCYISIVGSWCSLTLLSFFMF